MSAFALPQLWTPRSIAVVGASRDRQKVGHTIFRNLVESGYDGQLFPINPQASQILNHKVYPSLSSLPIAPELVIVVIPGQFALQIAEEAGLKGSRALIVISAGFKETGKEGLAREQDLVHICRRHQLRLLGPNCLGIVHTPSKLNASFAALPPRPGSIAILSQSGALGTAFLDKSVSDPLFGISTFVSLGNKADLDETNLLGDLAAQPETKVILSYCESLPHGYAFVQKARQITQSKPVVMLKSGRTASGQKAVASHTGSLAGSDVAYSAGLQQAGIIRVDTLDEMFDLGVAFSHLPKPMSAGLAIITNAGGPAIMATDSLAKTSLKLAHLHNVTKTSLMKSLPASASVKNPVDILGDALSERYQHALETVVSDTAVAMITVILTPQSMTEVTETARVIIEVAKTTDKPVVACFIGEARVGPGIAALKKAKIPVFASPERCVWALAQLYRYHHQLQPQVKATLHQLMSTAHQSASPPGPKLHLLAEPLSAEGKLDSLVSLELAHRYGLPMPKADRATSATQAAEIAGHFGYPVVLKIDSLKINHKTEFDGIRLNLENELQVRAAYTDLTKSATKRIPAADIQGCLVQTQVKASAEFLVGMQRDPDFGPVLTFGLGGIMVEVWKEAASCVLPATPDQIMALLTATKARAFFEGFRGLPKVNQVAVGKILSAVAQMSLDYPEIDAIDINPVLANSHGAWAADVRIIVKRPVMRLG